MFTSTFCRINIFAGSLLSTLYLSSRSRCITYEYVSVSTIQYIYMVVVVVVAAYKLQYIEKDIWQKVGTFIFADDDGFSHFLSFHFPLNTYSFLLRFFFISSFHSPPLRRFISRAKISILFRYFATTTLLPKNGLCTQRKLQIVPFQWKLSRVCEWNTSYVYIFFSVQLAVSSALTEVLCSNGTMC